jgi:hypothetical protein
VSRPDMSLENSDVLTAAGCGLLAAAVNGAFRIERMGWVLRAHTRSHRSWNYLGDGPTRPGCARVITADRDVMRRALCSPHSGTAPFPRVAGRGGILTGVPILFVPPTVGIALRAATKGACAGLGPRSPRALILSGPAAGF